MKTLDGLTIDGILDHFDLTQVGSERRPDLEPITIWVPSEHKKKYDQLQIASKKKFGKTLKEVVKMAIERVDLIVKD